MTTTAGKTTRFDTTWADNVPILGPGIPPLGDFIPVEEIERELINMPHIDGDIRHEDDHAIDHEFRDARRAKLAVETIGRLPDSFDCFHIVISGKFALWNMVPAILELAAPIKIAALTVATLGFSKANIAEMMQLMDAGKIARVSMLCSHYFRGTSKGIWEFAAAELAKRRTARFLSIRTHAKLLLVKLEDGRTVTIESSANLRSCKNIETATILGHPRCYEFHTGWIDQLFSAGRGDA